MGSAESTNDAIETPNAQEEGALGAIPGRTEDSEAKLSTLRPRTFIAQCMHVPLNHENPIRHDHPMYVVRFCWQDSWTNQLSGFLGDDYSSNDVPDPLEGLAADRFSGGVLLAQDPDSPNTPCSLHSGKAR